METQSHNILTGINYFFFGYFVIINMIYMFLLALAARVVWAYRNRVDIEEGIGLPDAFAKPFSVIVPAYNEEVNIVETTRTLLSLEHPEHEVIICSDGSEDETLQRLITEFELEEVDVSCPVPGFEEKIRGIYFSRSDHKLMVIDKGNTGKADSLNTAQQWSRYPYLCAVDADSMLASDSMSRMMQDFVAVPGIVACGGIIRISNGSIIQNGRIKELRVPEGMLERIQIVEYFRAFLFGRIGMDRLNALLIISGAFGVFRRDALDAVNGWLPSAIGEDMELVIKIQKHIRDKNLKQHVTFSPYPVCWTEVPATLEQLGTQRDRWQRALSQCIIQYFPLFLNPRYGAVGIIAYPYFLLFEFLSAPIELVGYPFIIICFIAGIIEIPFLVIFVTVAGMWGLCISAASLLLAEISFQRYVKRKAAATLGFAAFCENFGYRQIHAYWRCRGMVKYFMTGNLEWGHMQRKGYKHLEGDNQ